ncbi:MAG: CmcJ/NvfI family oxidoreductase [Pseudomonadota bacterium]
MNVMASVNYFVKRDMIQAFHFDVDGVAGNLISPDLVAEKVTVKDLRENKDTLNFNDNGICFTKFESTISDFREKHSWQSIYDNEIKNLLRDKIGAKEVIVFDHTVRMDMPNAVRKPARNVHNDYSEKAANQRLNDLVGKDQAIEFQKGSFGFVNVWRPIEDMIISSPLGFICPHSMQSKDWINIELIYPDRIGQILGVVANPKHQWFYLSKMTPTEAIIFNIYDNKNRPHLAHSALDIESGTTPSKPRKSIETRVLIRYE